MAASLDGLSPNVPLYKLTEGNEPGFFTTYFSWDPVKASAHGNSFQKKVMLLFGAGHAVEKSNGSNNGGPTQRASALAALNSAFNSSTSPRAAAAARAGGASQASQRAAAVAALSSVLTAETKRSPHVSPARSSRSPPAEAPRPAPMKSEDADEVANSKEVPEVKETKTMDSVLEANGEDSGSKSEIDKNENGSDSNQSTFSYEQLRAKSDNPVTGIDFKRRETYLSEEEFQTVLGMTKEAFCNLPRWKQDMLKSKVDLF